MKFLIYSTVFVCVIFMLGFLILKGLADTYETYQMKVYEAWKRQNPTSQMPFNDWRLLNSNNLLPGQVQPAFDPSNAPISPNP